MKIATKYLLGAGAGIVALVLLRRRAYAATVDPAGGTSAGLLDTLRGGIFSAFASGFLPGEPLYPNAPPPPTGPGGSITMSAHYRKNGMCMVANTYGDGVVTSVKADERACQLQGI